LAKHLSTTAKEPHAWEYSHDLVGYNYRLPNLNAALLCAQMEQLDSFIAKKRITATLYQAFFKNRGNPKFKTAPSYCKSNHWLNAIEFKNLGERDNFLQTSNENGIMTRPIWKLLNNLSMYKKSPSGNLKNAIYLEERIVNIPSSVIR
ncbi:MAG: DegT/DnrJ/EryC1/StrS family aminotransferase, partial [Saprospiraceae bacterium]